MGKAPPSSLDLSFLLYHHQALIIFLCCSEVLGVTVGCVEMGRLAIQAERRSPGKELCSPGAESSQQQQGRWRQEQGSTRACQTVQQMPKWETWDRDILATRPSDPPVPSASLPSESSVSRGPPKLSVLPAPSAPRRGPPWRAPSRRGRMSLFTLSASQLPFLGARGHKKG